MSLHCAAAPADVSFVFTIVLWPQLGQKHLRELAGGEVVGKRNLWVDVSEFVFPAGSPWTNAHRGLCFRENVLHKRPTTSTYFT